MPCDLTRFLSAWFPCLTLEAGLFYRWPIGIRFELAGQSPSLSERISQATYRAAALYEAAFAVHDQCVLVSQDWRGDCESASPQRLSPLFAFSRTEGIGLSDPVGEVDVLATGESGDDTSHTLKWTEQPARNFKYREIFLGIANADHGLEPSIGGRVYFLNPGSQVILHMYDDRGLDVVATDKRSLNALYENFNAWILDYDRARIDAVFSDAR